MERTILKIAALLHDVGKASDGKRHHKASFRMIAGMKPPLGWNEEIVRAAASVARYHRGALPRAGQKSLAGFTRERRQMVLRLAGILRLANVLDKERDGRISRLKVEEKNGALVISAEGYSSRDSLAEEVAAGRHLLETVLRRAILIKPLRRPPSTRVPALPRNRPRAA